MFIQKLHPHFIMPTKGSSQAGAFDIYMPDSDHVYGVPKKIGLGFSAAVPIGHVALLLPRSSTGAKYGLELYNTCGVIDSDYRGEWIATLATKPGTKFSWTAGERILQFLIVPVANVTLTLVDSLDKTERGEGGFGSSGI